jgi:hypothetical protein
MRKNSRNKYSKQSDENIDEIDQIDELEKSMKSMFIDKSQVKTVKASENCNDINQSAIRDLDADKMQIDENKTIEDKVYADQKIEFEPNKYEKPNFSDSSNNKHIGNNRK